jgi:quinol monooxygenase YgiN
MIGRMKAEPGRGEELASIVLDGAAALEADEDCLMYVVAVSQDDPDTVLVSEAWRTEDAHRASLERDEVRALISRAGPLLAGPPDPIRIRPLGGKGLPPSAPSGSPGTT